MGSLFDLIEVKEEVEYGSGVRKYSGSVFHNGKVCAYNITFSNKGVGLEEAKEIINNRYDRITGFKIIELEEIK